MTGNNRKKSVLKKRKGSVKSNKSTNSIGRSSTNRNPLEMSLSMSERKMSTN